VVNANGINFGSQTWLGIITLTWFKLEKSYHHSPYNIFWVIDMAWSYYIHTTPTWEEATTVIPIIGYFDKDYIEMIFPP
jgi:hypothetical protein